MFEVPRQIKSADAGTSDVAVNFVPLAEIDFVEDLGGAAFQIRNPNAQSSCGCGNSFSV